MSKRKPKVKSPDQPKPPVVTPDAMVVAMATAEEEFFPTDWDKRNATDRLAEKLKAVELLAQLQEKKLQRVQALRLEMFRANTIDAARQIASRAAGVWSMTEQDMLLRHLCETCGGWDAFLAKGADDAAIAKLLIKFWPQCNHRGTVPTCQRGYHYGGKIDLKQIQAWVDLSTDPDNDKPTLAGKALIDAVRRVMEIPQPPKASPKPNTKPHSGGGPAYRKQTWGQWAATLRGITTGGIDLPANPANLRASEREKFFFDAFNKGTGPAAARDAWLKKVGAIQEKPAKVEMTEQTLKDFVDRGNKAQAAADAATPANKPRQTWRQFINTVKHLPDGVELRPSVHEVGAPTPTEQFFLDRWKEGNSPSEALRAWQAIPEERKQAVAARKTVELSDDQIKAVLSEAKHFSAADLMSRDEYVKDFGSDVIDEMLARGLLIALRGAHDGHLDITISGREWLASNTDAGPIRNWNVGDLVSVKGTAGVIASVSAGMGLADVNCGVAGYKSAVPFEDLRPLPTADAFPFKKGDRVIAHGVTYTISEITTTAGPAGTLYDLKCKAGGKPCWLSNYYLKNGKVTNGIDELVAAAKGKPAA